MSDINLKKKLFTQQNLKLLLVHNIIDYSS